MEKKALVAVSFGTTHTDTLKKCIEAVEKDLKNVFEGWDFFRAFTSRIVKKRLSSKGINVKNEMEVLEELYKKGYTRVVLQPLHIIPGYEYEKVKKAAEQYKDKTSCLIVSEPLLFREDDYEKVADFLISISKDAQGAVMMGHGTEHFLNACYYRLQSSLSSKRKGFYIANVEGFPSIESAARELKKEHIQKVRLFPLMLVAGDHAQNDMAGDGDSFKNILLKKGFETEVLIKGLGEYKEIRDIFVQKALKEKGKVDD